ncbi:hypothetical protein EJ08DRAFT_332375 [Tothia fuscella]|uniref:Uncharacterized protein n=1 Tax=Tothia fuscella TaxID=1048955 RepID=A0A9P4NN18_9PEZI|nr:hypothetical protein EJ08DRAFT_332375 [Tothia fuscella]
MAVKAIAPFEASFVVGQYLLAACFAKPTVCMSTSFHIYISQFLSQFQKFELLILFFPDFSRLTCCCQCHIHAMLKLPRLTFSFTLNNHFTRQVIDHHSPSDIARQDQLPTRHLLVLLWPF